MFIKSFYSAIVSSPLIPSVFKNCIRIVINFILKIFSAIANHRIIYDKEIEFIGLLVLSAYVYFTYRLWKESKSQTCQLVDPCVVFSIEEKSNAKYSFIIENVGKGVALNVSLANFIMYITDSPKITLKLVFDKINILKSGEKVGLSYTEYINGKQSDRDNSFLAPFLQPAYQKEKNFIFIITYHSIDGGEYFTKFQTGKDGVKMFRKGIGRLSFRKKIWFWTKEKIEYYKIIMWSWIKEKVRYFKDIIRKIRSMLG